MQDDKLKKLYDELYDNGYHRSFQLSHSRNLIEIIEKTVSKNSIILDVGCSHGLAVDMLKKKGYNSYGIDIADKAIEYCKQRGLSTCKCCSADNITFEDNFFDVILSTDVLEHIPTSMVNTVVNEFNRVTKDDASVFIKVASVPERHRWDTITEHYGCSNLHLTTEGIEFWEKAFNEFFVIENIITNYPTFFEVVLRKKQ